MRGRLLLALLVAAGCGSVSTEKMDAAMGSAADAAIDAPTSCPIGVTDMCAGDSLVTCDGQGNITNTTSCVLGCSTANKRCFKVASSNNLDTFMDEAATAPDLVLSGSTTIDTDAASITDQSGVRSQPNSIVTAGLPIGVMVIKAKTFETGGTVTVTGSRALAIVVDGAITINHPINVSAPLTGNGPGALPNDTTGRGGDGAAGATEGSSGGGGGGFGTAGGRGGTGGVATVNGGNPGGVSGNGTLIPLRGGTPGGLSGISSASHTVGGGGGAIQLVSNVSITLGATGLISANGGGARGPNIGIACLANSPCGHGEAGGSGGGILLETPVLTMNPASGLYANGGAGKCGVTGSAQSGLNSTTPAAGQTCTSPTGNGGNGAAGATPAQNGGNTSGDNAVGGGAGGGQGRIRVNLKAGTTFSPAGTVSGVESAGAVGTR
jgi:hypothetical protein